MTVIAIIPARGGSKRIPRKNLQRIGGTSLLGWSVRECIRAGLQTYVSTDDDEIAAEARKYGADVHPRDEAFAADDATSEAVMRNSIRRIRAASDDVVVMVQCTSPFTTAGEIRAAVDAVGRTDNQRKSVCAFAAYRPQLYLWRYVSGGWVSSTSLAERKGTFVGDDAMAETGAFYVRHCCEWIGSETRFGEGATAMPLAVKYPVDIDTPEDLANARTLYTMRPELQRMNAPAVRPAMVVFDVDGTLTDGCTPMRFSRRDGAVFCRLREAGHLVHWVTAEPVGSAAFERAATLDVPCHYVSPECRRKWLEKFAVQHYLSMNQIAYVGDSDTDAAAIAAVGAGFAPSDAMPEARLAARYILGPGGSHVAEQVEMLLRGWEDTA